MVYFLETVIFGYKEELDRFTVPQNVTSITITAIGASGGASTGFSGFGAIVQGDFTVTPGEILAILVGGMGYGSGGSGGGGGSFVWRGKEYSDITKNNALLVTAGGGGGADTDSNGLNASTSQEGTAGENNYGSGGTGGSGGLSSASASGGAGILSSGQSAQGNSEGGTAIYAGAKGGSEGGGFGGGGGGAGDSGLGGGGGGGFSGGGAGSNLCAGGGGGSYNADPNGTIALALERYDNGEVIISYTPIRRRYQRFFRGYSHRHKRLRRLIIDVD